MGQRRKSEADLPEYWARYTVVVSAPFIQKVEREARLGNLTEKDARAELKVLKARLEFSSAKNWKLFRLEQIPVR